MRVGYNGCCIAVRRHAECLHPLGEAGEDDGMRVQRQGVSARMDKSIQIGIGQKVRTNLTRLFDGPHALLFVCGLALFYAWDLCTIYCEHAVAAEAYNPVPYFSILVTSAAATAGFVAIGVGLHKLQSFNFVGLIGTVVAGVATVVAALLVQVEGIDAGVVRLVADAIARLGSCWVIVAWGSQYARLDAFRITAYTLISFILALAACLVMLSCPQVLRVAFVAVALPLSMALVLRASRMKLPEHRVVGRETFIGLTWRILLVFFLFGIVTWTSIPWAQASAGVQGLGQLVIVGSGGVVTVLLVLALVTGGAFSQSYIYKVVLPLITAGILLVATLNFETNVGAALISIGYTCFDLFCFALFANACRKTGVDARRVFSWCRAIESSTPFFTVILMVVLEGLLHMGDSLMVNLISGASMLVVVAVIMLDQTDLFEREQLNPAIDYPRAEVLYFARQCEEAIARFGLSPREAEVLSLIVRGRSVPHISQRLFISRSTVKTHISHLYEKLGVSDRQEMIDVIESIALSQDE